MRPALDTPVLPADHPVIPTPKVGVLLVNLGSPEAPTRNAVKAYLKEFLSDRRVVELPPILWQIILRGFVLNTRPSTTAHAYRQIWTEAGSPLAAITAEQAYGLTFGDNVIVDWAMRYGKPAIADRVKALKEAGCQRILIAPLYPQYAEGDALATRAPHPTTVARRPGLYRRTEGLGRAAGCGAVVRTRSHCCQFPFDAGLDARGW